MLDFDRVRAFYFDPPTADPERIPSREELTARYERRRVENCLLSGGCPKTQALGPHGSLIGGPDKPPTVHHAFPELVAKLHPLPLAWFDHHQSPGRGLSPRRLEGAHIFFRSLSHAYLAGTPNPPNGVQLRRHFRAAALGGTARAQVRHIFASIRAFDLHQLFARGGISIYEIARAIHLSRTRRALVVNWINQFAGRPTSADKVRSVV